MGAHHLRLFQGVHAQQGRRHRAAVESAVIDGEAIVLRSDTLPILRR